MSYSPPFERVMLNDARTALDANVSAVATSFNVVDGSQFPANPNFRILVGSEIMLVTARSSNTLTVIRGQEGTTAAVHNLGTSVRGANTKGSFEQVVKDNTPFYKEKPVLGRLTDDTGADLTSDDFTWVNQGGATATDVTQGIRMQIPRSLGANPDLRILQRTAPSTPYTVTACIAHSLTDNQLNTAQDYAWGSLLFRESSSGKLQGPVSTGNNRMEVVSWTDQDTIAANPLVEAQFMKNNNYMWYKLEDDGTNVNYSVSNNGIEFMELYSVLRGNHFDTGPDQICFVGNGRWGSTLGSDADHIAVLLHWREE